MSPQELCFDFLNSLRNLDVNLMCRPATGDIKIIVRNVQPSAGKKTEQDSVFLPPDGEEQR